MPLQAQSIAVEITEPQLQGKIESMMPWKVQRGLLQLVVSNSRVELTEGQDVVGLTAEVLINSPGGLKVFGRGRLHGHLETKSLDSGKPMTFVNNKTKATIMLTPEAAKDKAVKPFKVATAVEPHRLRMVPPRDNTAFVDTPVFTDTNDKATPGSIIKKGDPIHMVATVEGRNDWAAVIDAHVVVGYVSLRYLDQKIVKLEQAAKDKAPKAKVAATPPAVPVAPTLAAAPNPQLALAQRPADGGAVRLVKAMGTCKTVTRTIDTGKKVESFTVSVKYCQEPPPKWKTISTRSGSPHPTAPTTRREAKRCDS